LYIFKDNSLPRVLVRRDLVARSRVNPQGKLLPVLFLLGVKHQVLPGGGAPISIFDKNSPIGKSR